jgi:hypothetical protein
MTMSRRLNPISRVGVALVVAFFILVAEGTVARVQADKLEDAALVVAVFGVVSFPISLISSLGNAEYLSRGKPNKGSGIVGFVSGATTAYAGLIFLDEWKKSNGGGYLSAGATFTAVGVASVTLGLLNVSREESIDDPSGAKRIALAPALASDVDGRRAFGFVIAVKF